MNARKFGKPRFLSLYKSGELAHRAFVLSEIYRSCTLCPHKCRVDRTAGKIGKCRTTNEPKVASVAVHHGEEPSISGTNGSGTIFFSGCTGQCIFCQNYPISQLNTGTVVSPESLADMMLSLQTKGCHNINLVTPTHVIPTFVQALVIAASKGLTLPIVYNSSGYESIETLKLLDGIIDIYLPDLKYADDTVAMKVSGFRQYTTYNKEAICEMFRQTGNLRVHNGIAYRGIIVRHLVLPDNLGGTEEAMTFLAGISREIRVSLMDQYFPAYNAFTHDTLSRKITNDEYNRAQDAFHASGLKYGWIQDHENNCSY